MDDKDPFLDFIKAGLEAGGPVPSAVQARIVGRIVREGGRSHRVWNLCWRSALAAAAVLAVTLGFFLHAGSAEGEREMVEALSFLNTAEGYEEREGITPAEKLLAWQDAPYVALAEETAGELN